MSNFEWYTEDDDRPWQGDAPAEGGEPGGRRRQVTLLIVALLLITGAIVVRQLRAAVSETTSQIEQEIITTHNLLVSAAQSGDLTLFNTLISGRDQAWTGAQQMLAASGGLFERRGLGLNPADESPTIAEIELSPNLEAAVVTTSVPFVIPIGNGLLRTVTLNVPLEFRRGATNWLYVPAEAAVWGEQRSLNSGRLRVSYPARDAALVERLVADLELAAQTVCRDVACSGPPLGLAFLSDPLTLASLQIPAAAEAATNVLRLPTPSLVGVPADDAAYRALLAGYAQRTLSALIANAVGYTCCERVAFFDALVSRQLVALGFQPPLGPADYEAALATLGSLNVAPAAWRSADIRALNAGDRALAAALVEYLLLERTRQSADALYTHLRTFNDFGQFLQQSVIEDRATWQSDRERWLDALTADFEHYLTARTTPQASGSAVIISAWKHSSKRTLRS